MKGPIQVLIADDSPSVRRILEDVFRQGDEFEVVGSVEDGAQAIEAVERLRPDVVLLDVDMPVTDGLTALRQIMAHHPTPTVMISGAGAHAASKTFRALEEGAVDFLLKYTPESPWDAESLHREVTGKLRTASKVRAIRTLPARRMMDVPQHLPGSSSANEKPDMLHNLETLRTGVVVIGASTGGPAALRQLLQRLPTEFAQPILVVQHIPESFIPVLAAQLGRHTSLPVVPAEDGASLTPGVVFVAPGDTHLLLGPDGRIHLHPGPPVRGHRPAIDVTMQSAARIYGSKTCGVLLTGMGDDGAEGLWAIHGAGGRTFAQDEDSSVVWGMPGRAFQQGSVDEVAPPEQIARRLLDWAPPSDPHPRPRQVQGVSP